MSPVVRFWSALALRAATFAALPLVIAAAPAAPTPIVVLSGEVMLRTWVPPMFPAGVPADVVEGRARLRAVVDADGGVRTVRALDASRPEFAEAAIAATRQWVFVREPGRSGPTPCGVDIPFSFDRAHSVPAGKFPAADNAPRLSPRTAAAMPPSFSATYPPSLADRGLEGYVRFTCSVSETGQLTAFRVRQASHPDFVVATLRAARQWKFTPAAEGDLPLSGAVDDELTLLAPRALRHAPALAANGISAEDGTEPDPAPQIFGLVDPIWPVGTAAESAAEGKAEVEFSIGPAGRVFGVLVKSASAPEFGHALAAAVQFWRFAPVGAHPTTLTLVARSAFAPPDAATRSLLARASEGSLPGLSDLDRALVPVYQPEAPSVDCLRHGTAKIVCVVDEDGRARFPRVISAPDEAGGWLAATAVSQWVFEPPLRHGQPTAVLARASVEL